MKVPILDLKPAYEELRAELDSAYHRVMDSGRLLLGPELEAFESEYARSVGTAQTIGVANGLDALQLVLTAWGVGPGDEVIVPSNGYIATWLAVTHTGAKPIPCEPNPLTYNLDPNRLAAVITPRTKAVLPIHLYGQTADMPAIHAIAARHDLFVLEDAAQSHGARCHEKAAGAWGDAAGVSFYPSKNLGALADAGAITTDDLPLAERLRHLRNYGSKVRYQHDYLGVNSRLSELQAAFLRVKLRRLPEWNLRRTRLAAQYLACLDGVGDVVRPFVPSWAEPAWHLFVIRTAHRTALQEHLTRCDVGTQVHYPTPPHLTRAYDSLGGKRGDYPIAEALADEVLSLPIGPHISEQQVEHVCASIRSFFERNVRS